MVVLDTTILIAVQDGVEGADELIERFRMAGDALRVPAASWVEFMVGVPPAKFGAAQRLVEQGAIFHAFGKNEAETAVRLQSDLRRQGRRLGWHELQIVATALEVGEALISNDERIRDVPGLEIVRH